MLFPVRALIPAAHKEDVAMIRSSTAKLRAAGLAAAAAFVLGGCAAATATAAAAPEPQPHPQGTTENSCHADAAQSFVGQTASADTGTAMLKASGASVLRWVPPRTMVTMIYMNGRLTVSYDDDMKITRVSCN